MVSAVESPAAPSIKERVITTLDAASTPLTRKALRARLAVNNQRLGDALKLLEAEGMIRRNSDGWQR